MKRRIKFLNTSTHKTGENETEDEECLLEEHFDKG